MDNIFAFKQPSLSIEIYKPEKHYEILASWWSDYKWPVVPAHLLPPMGWVVYNEEIPVIAGFLYFTDSPIAAFDWVISNPSSLKEDRKLGIKMIFMAAEVAAQKGGVEKMFSYISHPSLEKHYEDYGFMPADKKVTLMIKTVGE